MKDILFFYRCCSWFYRVLILLVLFIFLNIKLFLIFNESIDRRKYYFEENEVNKNKWFFEILRWRRFGVFIYKYFVILNILGLKLYVYWEFLIFVFLYGINKNDFF